MDDDGQYEKNVQDWHREIWREVAGQRWPSLEALNDCFVARCSQPSGWRFRVHDGRDQRPAARR